MTATKNLRGSSTSDPIRNYIWEAVHREVGIGSEGVQNLIEQLASDIDGVIDPVETKTSACGEDLKIAELMDAS